MAISSSFYAVTLKKFLQAEADVGTGQACLAQLTQDGHVPDFDTHEFRTSITGDAAAGTTDQTANITDTEVVVDTGDNRVEIRDSVGTLSFPTVTSGTIGGIIVYTNVGTAGTDQLVVQCDFSGGNITGNGSGIDVTITADGYGHITYV